MANEACAFDVELIGAGRDAVEREATFGVCDCRTQHDVVRVAYGDVRAAYHRAIRIFNSSGDLAVGVLCSREGAREDSAQESRKGFHKIEQCIPRPELLPAVVDHKF